MSVLLIGMELRFKCEECGLEVYSRDYNFRFKVCKWCAFKHTWTYKWQKKVEEFNKFCDISTKMKGGASD